MKSKFKSTITGEFLFNSYPGNGTGLDITRGSNWKSLSKEAKASWNQLAASTCLQVATDIERIFQ